VHVVKKDGGAAFVQYKHRACAEIAKIAMAEQTLFGQDLLNIRWAGVFDMLGDCLSFATVQLNHQYLLRIR
jgi:hypothetical protein